MKKIELEECRCCEWHHEPDDWPVDCRDDSRSYIKADVAGMPAAFTANGEGWVTRKAVAERDAKLREEAITNELDAAAGRREAGRRAGAA